MELVPAIILAVLFGLYIAAGDRNRYRAVIVFTAFSVAIGFWLGYVVGNGLPNNTGISFGLPSELEISIILSIGILIAIILGLSRQKIEENIVDRMTKMVDKFVTGFRKR